MVLVMWDTRSPYVDSRYLNRLLLSEVMRPHPTSFLPFSLFSDLFFGRVLKSCTIKNSTCSQIRRVYSMDTLIIYAFPLCEFMMFGTENHAISAKRCDSVIGKYLWLVLPVRPVLPVIFMCEIQQLPHSGRIFLANRNLSSKLIPKGH